METAAELIVHATVGHLPARVADDLESVLIAGANVCAQQELQRHGGRKLWCAAETAVNRVVISDHARVCRIQQLRLDRMIGTARFTQTPQLGDKRGARLTYVVLTFSISFGDTDQNSRKAG